MTAVGRLEGLLEPLALSVAVAAEAIAAVVIAVALAEAVWGGLKLFGGDMRRRRPTLVQAAKQDVRLSLARWLAVSLEFLLAADILRTAVAPTWDEIGKLAAVATLRTLLNYFLEREIQHDERRDAREAENSSLSP